MKTDDPFAGRVRVRCCGLIADGDYLLLVRQKTPTRPDPIWLPPGGGLQLGETSKTAVTREVAEETGITMKPSYLAFVHEFVEPPYHAVELYFAAESFTGTLKTGHDPELSEQEQQILDCAFINPKTLTDKELYPPFLHSENVVNLSAAGEVKHFLTS